MILLKRLLGSISCKGKHKGARRKTSGSREREVLRKETEGKHQLGGREQRKGRGEQAPETGRR